MNNRKSRGSSGAPRATSSSRNETTTLKKLRATRIRAHRAPRAGEQTPSASLLNLEFLQARFNGSAGFSDRPGNPILTSFDVGKDPVTRIQQLLEVLGLAAHWLFHCRLGSIGNRGDPAAARGLARSVKRWCPPDRRVGECAGMSPES